DLAAALGPLHPSPRRLSFRLHHARADWRYGFAVRRQGAGAAGVRARRPPQAANARTVAKAVQRHVRRRRQPSRAACHDVGSFLQECRHTIGHFDFYGCLLAMCLLLIPARSVAYVLLAAVFSIVLVMIHHIHVLMYVPTIAAIVVLRYYLLQGITSQNVVAGI